MNNLAASQSTFRPLRATLQRLSDALRWLVGGALLIALLYQLPARHVVTVGFNDAGYVQGWSDPVNRWGVIDPASDAATPLRWSRDRSAIIFPQIGLPATATVRLRADPAAPATQTVRVLLNGAQEIGRVTATDAWTTHSFRITGGLLKANDLFLELRTEPVTMVDGAARGVQVEHAALATAGWPILPYPAQLLYGGLSLVFAASLVRGRRRFIVVLAIGLAWLFLYRLQLGSLGLRTLPPMLTIALGMLALVAAQPRVQRWAQTRAPAAIAAGMILIWLGWLLLVGRVHTSLSLPGVERDFPVFANRAGSLTCPPDADWRSAPCVLRADGFYNLGYPFLLWLLSRAGNGDAFDAAKVVSAIGGAIMLGATWALARRLIGAAPALLAIAVLALSPFVVQYGLYVGTDMAFAALWTAALALLLAPQALTWRAAALAGLLAGAAFLIRHPGIVLLPWGLIALAMISPAVSQRSGHMSHLPWRLWTAFAAAWLVAILPQLVVNLRDAGAPLWSQQAKNIWLAVYGNTDYSGRWADASNDVALRDLVLADPARFWGNWSRNLVALLGSGAEDTSEFGRSIALRLLHVPANMLALAGLGLWLWQGERRARLLLLATALYALGVTVGFALPRFFLPIAPVLAIAAVASLIPIARRLALRWPRMSHAQWLLLGGLILIWLMARGPQIGARYVLERQSATDDSAHRSHVVISRVSHP